MAKFIVGEKTFEIPEEKLKEYPQSILTLIWEWRDQGADSVLLDSIQVSDFQIIVNFYLTGKWPNKYLKCNRMPTVTVGGDIDVDAADYFLLPSDPGYMEWDEEIFKTPDSPPLKSLGEEWTPSHFGDRDYENGDYQDKDCLWAEREYQEDMRRADERAEWDAFDDYMERFM